MQGVQCPFVIVGDSAYPLLPWLTKPFPGIVNAQQREFNRQLSSMRVTVECAFGRLQARFRCLMKRIDLHYTFVPYVVGACCVLHNIVENFNDPMPEVPQCERIFEQPLEQELDEEENLDARNVRNALFQHFLNNL